MLRLLMSAVGLVCMSQVCLAKCVERSRIDEAHPNLGPSCQALVAQVGCIEARQIYVNDNGIWKLAQQAEKAKPTSQVSADPLRPEDLSDALPAYEFLYVSDTQGYDRPYAILGVTIARRLVDEHVDDIHLYRNSVQSQTRQSDGGYSGLVNAVTYQNKLGDWDGAGVIEEIDQWRQVPEYQVDSTGLEERPFLYGIFVKDNKHWKTSLKIRQLTGAISCIDFKAAVRIPQFIHSLRVRAFLQHDPTAASVAEFGLQ